MDKQGYMQTCGECNAVDIGGRINHYQHCSGWDGKTGRKVSVSSAHAKPQWEQIEDLQNLLHGAQAESDRRLRLLWLANEDRVITGNRCPICKKLPEMVAIVNTEYKYKDNHEAGCELAEEVK